MRAGPGKNPDWLLIYYAFVTYVEMSINETLKTESVLRLLKHPLLVRLILIREFTDTIVPLVSLHTLVKKLLKISQEHQMVLFQSWDIFLTSLRDSKNSRTRSRNGSLKIPNSTKTTPIF
jgi:hypothetical protein